MRSPGPTVTVQRLHCVEKICRVLKLIAWKNCDCRPAVMRPCTPLSVMKAISCCEFVMTRDRWPCVVKRNAAMVPSSTDVRLYAAPMPYTDAPNFESKSPHKDARRLACGLVGFEVSKNLLRESVAAVVRRVARRDPSVTGAHSGRCRITAL